MYSRDDRNIKYSLIIPVFRALKFADDLELMISNIKEFKDETEILLIDDASGDGTADMLLQLEKKYSNVYCILKEHGGISDTRNRGINLAKGKFLLFVDSDDTMEVDKVIRLAQENDFDLLVYSFYQWKNNERIDGRSLEDKRFCIENDIPLFLKNHYKEFAGSVWNKILKKELIDRYHIRFIPESKIGNEDILFNLMYLCHCRTVVFSKQKFYLYKIYESSASHQSETGFEIVQRFCNCAYVLKAYAQKYGIEMKEFLYYFWIKELTLALRSCTLSEEKKKEFLAEYCIREAQVYDLAEASGNGVLDYFLKHEKKDSLQISCIINLQKAILDRNKQKLEIFISEFLKRENSK